MPQEPSASRSVSRVHGGGVVRFGGVDFHFEADPPLGFPEPEQRLWMEPPGDAPPFARVTVGVTWVSRERVASPRRGKGPPPVQAEWAPDGRKALVRTDGLRLRLCREGAVEWYLEGEAERTARGAERVLATVVSLLAEAHGGLSLHAATVSWAGRAVAFLGPSGAGKSTAAGRLAGARWLGHDRLVLWPGEGGGWWGWGLPWGGAVSSLVPAPRRHAPLGALLRVVRGEHTTVQRLLGVEALLVVRAAVWRGFPSRVAEEARLDAACRLVSEVPIARLVHRLGESFEPPLRALLADGEAP